MYSWSSRPAPAGDGRLGYSARAPRRGERVPVARSGHARGA